MAIRCPCKCKLKKVFQLGHSPSGCVCLLGDGPDVGQSVLFSLFKRAQLPLQGRCPTPRDGGPAVSAADTRVAVSGSSRLQSADAALYLTGPGQSPVRRLKMTWSSKLGVSVGIRQMNDAFLASLRGLWPDLKKLYIAGEQRRHLQTSDIGLSRE